MPIDEMESRSTADGRYRTLLEVCGAIATQPNWKAGLQSLRRLLSSVVAFNSLGLLLLSDTETRSGSQHLTGDREADEFEIGTQVAHAGTAVGRAIDEQKPIYVPDVKTELSMIPQLAAKARLGSPHSSHIFPITISGNKLGENCYPLHVCERLLLRLARNRAGALPRAM